MKHKLALTMVAPMFLLLTGCGAPSPNNFSTDAGTFANEWRQLDSDYKAQNASAVQRDYAEMENTYADLQSDSEKYAQSSGAYPDISSDMQKLVNDANNAMQGDLSKEVQDAQFGSEYGVGDGDAVQQWNLDMQAYNDAIKAHPSSSLFTYTGPITPPPEPQ